MAKTETNPAAGVALDYTMDRLCESASPWRVPPDVWERSWNAIAPDFNRQITSFDQWLKFKVPVLRLAKYLGAFAAYLAETDAGATAPVGDVKWEHMLLAMALVKIECPAPRADNSPLCAGVLPDKSAVFDDLHAALKAAAAKLAGS